MVPTRRGEILEPHFTALGGNVVNARIEGLSGLQERCQIMTRRILLLISALALLVGMLPAAAQTSTPDASRLRPVQGGGSVDMDFGRGDPNALALVFIQFTTPSVARFSADRIAATGNEPSQGQQLAQADAIANQHTVMRTALSSFLVELRSEQRFALNGFTAMVKTGDIPAISRIPGVLSVLRVKQHYPDHALSLPAVGAPTVWGSMGNFTGDGLTIAVIDSGIDYHHATFGGSGNPAHYAADSGLTLNDAFPNGKVISGWDFVGDAYDASSDLTDTPAPDPNPLDCATGNAGGHGTHVAGTAGGYGVLANGTTFTGPYNATTFADNVFLVGPGVAPEVYLVALRVFGCSGSSAVVHEAIDWAVQYNVLFNPIDVINMSLGSGFGESNDPSAIAAQNASDSGIIVVAASGNAGNIPYITGSPGVAPGVISVAGSIAGGTIQTPALSVTAPEGIAGLYAMSPAAFGPTLEAAGEVPGTLIAGTPILGCDPLTNGADVAGKIVLLQRGVCNFTVKYNHAVAAGAIGLVVYNSVSGPPFTMGGDGAVGTIPAVMVADTTGATLLGALTPGPVTVLISPDITIPLVITPDEPYASSSRGPGRGGSTFKPEVTAPAVNVESADVGTGTGGVRFSGTSMATPHVSGIAAMLRESHPDASPATIKSLMMNSGRPLVPANLPITRQAGGIVQADVAVELEAYTSPGGVAFGRLNPITGDSATQSVTVNNMSDSAQTFDIAITRYDTVGGVTVTAPASLNVAAGGSESFDLTITLDPAAMPEDDAWHSQREAYGAVTLSGDTDDLRLTFNAVVDGASNTVALGGDDGFGLTNDSDQYSLAYAFTTIGSGGGFDALGAAGFGGTAAFGFALDEGWEPMSGVVMDLWLDVDQDGEDDYLVRGVDLGIISGVGYNGFFVSVFYNLGAGTAGIQFYGEVDFNDRVMTLFASHGGAFSGEIDFFAEAWNLRSGDTMAITDGSFDMGAAIGAVYVDIEAGEEFSGADLGPLAAPGMLWLFPNNPLETQAQVTTAINPVEPTVGAFDPATGQWHLRDSAGAVTSFYFGGPGDVPIVGDWNGDGVDTVGVYRDGLVLLRNSNSGGIADVMYYYGSAGDVPIAGDWNDDGYDTVSIYRPSKGQVFITNEIGAGGGAIIADFSYYFGIPGDKPFAGDFDGDGVDTVGLHRESSGLVYFRNSHTQGFADNEFYFGIPADRLFAGDFGNVDFIDTPGVFRPSNTTWYFRHSNTMGFADSQFVWGQSHWLPVAGNFGLDD